MSDKLSIPSFRFQFFFDDWKKYKLSDIKDVRDGTHDSPKYKVTGVPLITSKNLTESGLDMKNVSLISDEDFESINKRSKVDIGDIIFGMIGTIGNPIMIDREDFAIKNVALIKDGGNVINSFLLQLLKSPIFNKYIYMENVGNTQKFLSLSKIRNYILLVPDIIEQEKIGSFFNKLDKTITIQQQLLNDHKQLKKAMLQKMFPQKGESVPRVRFAGFTDNWEERMLMDVIEKQIKGKAQLNKLDVGEIQYLDTSRLNGGPVFLSDGEKNVSKEDIIILWDGSKAGTIYKGFEGTLGSTLKAYSIGKENNSELIYQYLLKNQQVIYTNYRTPNIPHVVKDFAEVFSIMTPTLEEQEKIGDFFEQLDETITLHEKKLETYQELKKAMLQKMFV